MHTIRFHALGSTIEGGFVIDVSESFAALAKELRERIEEFENRFTRFWPTSELSQINAMAGRHALVSDAMMDLLRTAKELWKTTNGLIDPTIGKALIRAGYDASFDRIRPDLPASFDDAPIVKATYDDVVIDQKEGMVTVPLGVALDLGGIGKGYLLDHVAPSIERITKNFWLSFGGDMLVSGTNEDGQPWTVGVQNPLSLGEDSASLRIPAGRWAIATSGTTKRHGKRGGVAWHHIIDPRTGRPSDSDVLAATVLAATALEADAFAKTVLLLGLTDGLAFAQAQKIEAAVVTKEGSIRTTPMMESFLTLR